MIEKLKSYFAQGNRAQWGVFLLFGFTILLKSVLFHLVCFHKIASWGGLLTPVLFIASFVFLSKKNGWTIIANILVDIWLIANMFYFKANALFLSYETMQMADNMNGFWNSLYSYLGWDIYSYVIITALYILAYIPLRRMPSNRNVLKFAGCFALSVLLAIGVNCGYAKETPRWEDGPYAQSKYLPFGYVYYFANTEVWHDYNAFAYFYVRDFSILSYFPTTFIFNKMMPAGEIIPLSDEDISRVEPLFQRSDTGDLRPKTNLIFILCESLESWPLKEVCGYQYMPCLSSLLENEHVLYCDKMKSQTKHGNSADGQMIDVAGILPISNGATCRLYADNTFAGYAACYPHAAIMNPAPGMWGQSQMTFSYHFKELIEPSKGERWEDKELMEQMKQYIDTVPEPFCVLGITVTSHVPFARGSKYPKHTIDAMPSIMSAYLNCLTYCDSCIGSLLDTIFSSERLKDNTTIVISGDHNIFRAVNAEVDDFAKQNGICMQTANTFIPFLIYSPQINENIQITDTCYQMDIYPTILPLIGCEDYYWKGVGINLLDANARSHRPLPENEAYELSDKLIRTNYFKQ